MTVFPMFLALLLSFHVDIQPCSGFLLHPVSRRIATYQVLGRNEKPTTIIASPLSSSSTSLNGLFGGIFGSADQKQDAMLGSFDIAVKENADSNVSFESLSDYIRNMWTQLFVKGDIKLTTPVVVQQITSVAKEDGVEMATGVRLLFKKVDTGYKSKAEEDVDNERKGGGQNKGTQSQGGVEILVEKMDNQRLRVRARRCEIEDDTVIKEMSEETILHELKEAIAAWQKEKL
jgi:hypothetical protein